MIAKEFDKGDDERLVDRERRLGELIEKMKKGKATKKDSILARLLSSLIHGEKHKKRVLTPKHSASFSRSLRRLEGRGLIKRITDVIYNAVTDSVHHIEKKKWDSDKSHRIILTDKGREIARKIKRQAEDRRHKLEFKTL